MVNQDSSTLRRRRLGNELRTLREHAGITLDTGSDRLGFSPSKISRVENGISGVSTKDLHAMLILYQAPADQMTRLIRLAHDAKQKGWWHLYGQFLSGTFVEVESEAVRIKAFEAQCVPGLLQTVAYTRAVIRAAHPDITTAALDQRIEIRHQRQQRLTEPHPLDYTVVLDEAVFMRAVGGTTVMREQVDKVIAMAGRPHVTIRLLPASTGAHAAMDGSFTILEFDTPTSPNLVFAENAAGGLFLEQPTDYQHYATIFEHLRTKALHPQPSVDWLRQRRGEL